MAQLTERVSALGESAYFKEENIALLEGALQEQKASASKYAGRPNRGLLKLYSLFPARSNLDNILTVLVKALTALPNPDFLLALYLVPGQLQATPAVAALAELERSLQAAQFAAFWQRASGADVRPVLDSVAGFDDAVRGFIGSVLARTYARVDVGVAAAALHLPASDVPAYAAKAGWALSDDGAAVLPPPSADNSARKKEEQVSIGGAAGATGVSAGGLGIKSYADVQGLVGQLLSR